MELTIGDKVFYTKSTWLGVPVKVVGHYDGGYVELEYHVGAVWVVNHRYPMYSISFGIPSLDSPYHLRKSFLTPPVMRVIAALFMGGT